MAARGDNKRMINQRVYKHILAGLLIEREVVERVALAALLATG